MAPPKKPARCRRSACSSPRKTAGEIAAELRFALVDCHQQALLAAVRFRIAREHSSDFALGALEYDVRAAIATLEGYCGIICWEWDRADQQRTELKRMVLLGVLASSPYLDEGPDRDGVVLQ